MSKSEILLSWQRVVPCNSSECLEWRCLFRFHKAEIVLFFSWQILGSTLWLLFTGHRVIFFRVETYYLQSHSHPLLTFPEPGSARTSTCTKGPWFVVIDLLTLWGLLQVQRIWYKLKSIIYFPEPPSQLVLLMTIKRPVAEKLSS